MSSRVFRPMLVLDEYVIEGGDTISVEWRAPDGLAPMQVRWVLEGRGASSAELKKDELDGAVTRLSAQEDPHG